ncbi:hypothetical protein GDO81_013625 [Engystomops pustulosus]|uniref:Uncharacterized protein n=1 Tax=Engystomops pustulosus TaxID=76066 RepID=A0AAV7B4I0_ENGPU|nr:hypothetical protein GDO81_013625 [Engystomops pustulosus]
MWIYGSRVSSHVMEVSYLVCWEKAFHEINSRTRMELSFMMENAILGGNMGISGFRFQMDIIKKGLIFG